MEYSTHEYLHTPCRFSADASFSQTCIITIPAKRKKKCHLRARGVYYKVINIMFNNQTDITSSILPHPLLSRTHIEERYSPL